MLRMDARVCAVFFFQLICFVRFVLFSGVEHLLRDVKDTTISTLATEVIFHDWIFFPIRMLLCLRHTLNYLLSMQVTSKLAALKGLDARLREIRSYLDLVIEGKLPLNHEILYHLQVSLSLSVSLNYTERKLSCALIIFPFFQIKVETFVYAMKYTVALNS